MNRTELEARVVVLERLVISLLRQLELSDKIGPDDVEAIVSGIHADGDTPAVEYVVQKIDDVFPPLGTKSAPITIAEAMQRFGADIMERRRVFGPPDE